MSPALSNHPKKSTRRSPASSLHSRHSRVPATAMLRVTFTVLTSKLTSKFSSSHRSKVKANFWVSQSRFLAEIVTCGLRLTKSNLVTGPRSNLTQDREGGSECIRPDQLDCVLSVVGYRPKVRGGGGKFKTQIANWK